MLEPISVLATHTEDIVVEESGNVLTSQPGGSSLFIKQALSDANVRFRDFNKNRDKLTVKILLAQNQELGKVIDKPVAIKADSVPLTDWVIVSTVLDEWDILTLRKFPKKLIVDVQGYVRDGLEFGKKKNWESIEKIYKSIFCLKGTKEEIAYVPKAIVKDQKAKRMLVITNGSKSVEIFYKGKRHIMPVAPLEGLKDTIGAGDTFLGYFTAGLYKKRSVEDAGRYAIARTRVFLLDKTHKY